jgi:RND family efflux transporter MFP subunit
MSRSTTLAASAAALALAGGVLAVALVPSARGNDPAQPAQAAPQAGSSVELAERDVVQQYAADAIVEAVRSATVSAQISGQVTQLLVDAGDRVRRGQVLARIDTRDTDAQLAAGRANVAQAEAGHAQARLNFERTQRLVEQNFVSRAALDNAEAGLKTAQAAVEAARAGVTQASTARSYAEVRAPIDGVVTRRLLEPGEIASPGRGIVEVHDATQLRAVANVPQFVLRAVRQAQAGGALVQVPGLDAPIKPVRVAVLPAADARLLSTQVRADLPAEAAADVVPGTAAKILIPLGTARRLVVAAEAVVRRGELTAMQVIGADGTPRLRQVRTGATTPDGLVEVLAGAQAGERVLLQPWVASR